MELESYTFVLLRRPPNAPVLPEEELERVQAGHLAFLDAMRRRGALKLAGPFSEQPDESLRGFCLYATSIEETLDLIRDDPALRARRMVGDVFTWWTQKGAVEFPLALRASGSS